MNEFNSDIAERDFDRLVDGELSSPEYRRLLSRIEQSPEGWRRCAMAFLEAQALSEDMAWAMRTETQQHRVEVAPATAATSRLGGSFRRMERLAAMAACLAVAFGLGWAIQSSMTGGMPGNGPGPGPNVIANNPPNVPPVINPPVQTPRTMVMKPEFVYVNQWDGQNRTGVPIPVDPTRTFDPQQPWDNSWGMTAQDLQKLKDEGRQFETHNCLIPVSLENGDRVVVPMQEVILFEKPALPYH